MSLALGYVMALVLFILVVGMILYLVSLIAHIPDHTILLALAGGVVWIGMLPNSPPWILVSIMVGAAIGMVIYRIWNRNMR
jgi:hypothetical protein